MARAVQRLHRHGWFHNDVKPTNFLVDSADHMTRIMLSDYGTASEGEPVHNWAGHDLFCIAKWFHVLMWDGTNTHEVERVVGAETFDLLMSCYEGTSFDRRRCPWAQFYYRDCRECHEESAGMVKRIFRLARARKVDINAPLRDVARTRTILLVMAIVLIVGVLLVAPLVSAMIKRYRRNRDVVGAGDPIT